MLKEDISNHLYENTEKYIKNQNNELYTTQYISNIFGVKRNTIAIT